MLWCCAQNQQAPKSAREIAHHVGATVPVVKGLIASALQKLRSPSRAAFLQPFLEQAETSAGHGGESEAIVPGTITIAHEI